MTPRIPTSVPSRSRFLFLGAVLALGVLAACGDSTNPGGDGGEVRIDFSPGAINVLLVQGETLDFQVTVTGASPVIVWNLGGVDVGSGAVYRYAAVVVGEDTLTATVSAGGETRAKTWTITVGPDETGLPPEVGGVGIDDSQEPGTVVVKWRKVTESPSPVADYLIGLSYAGPVTAATWGQASVLAVVPHTADMPLQNQRTFGPADGITPGAVAWFGVRARDVNGAMSPISREYSHRVTYPWYLDVTVRDDTGAPLPLVILYYEEGSDPETTDAAGFARLGPFRSVDAKTVRTVSDHFDILSEAQSVADGDTVASLELVLPDRYFLEHVSCGATDPTDFLALLRHVTLTDDVSGAGKGYRLYRWEEYPLSVWIPRPAVPHALGWDVQALSAAALPIWNETLGEDYFVTAADSLSADIVFSFVPLPPTYNGITELLEPAGILGEKIPQRMIVKIDSDLGVGLPSPQEIWFTEVALHELGHTLGFNGHICIAPVGNLMDFGGAIGSISANGAANAISADEWRVVRAIRHIPQGTDMSLYDPAP